MDLHNFGQSTFLSWAIGDSIQYFTSINGVRERGILSPPSLFRTFPRFQLASTGIDWINAHSLSILVYMLTSFHCNPFQDLLSCLTKWQVFLENLKVHVNTKVSGHHFCQDLRKTIHWAWFLYWFTYNPSHLGSEDVDVSLWGLFAPWTSSSFFNHVCIIHGPVLTRFMKAWALGVQP